jgi:PAS domain S-box-containing protein
MIAPLPASQERVLLVSVEAELARSVRRSPDRSLVFEELPDGAALADALACDGPRTGAVVLGAGLADPIGAAQRVYRIDRNIPVLVLSDPVRGAALRSELMFTPFLGREVRFCPPGEAQLLRARIEQAAKRRRQRSAYESALASEVFRLGALALPQPAATHYLGRLLEVAPVGVITLDAEGVILAMNPRAVQMLASAERQALGSALGAAFPESERAALRELLAQPAANDEPRVLKALRVRSGDGTQRILEAVATPLSLPPRQRGWILILVDVSERARVEAELRALTASLETRVVERTARLEAALRELESFSYSVSHDLRAPLRAIGAFARMVVEDEGRNLSAEGRRMLSVVEANALKLGQLVDDLLRLARLSRSVFQPRRVDLRALALSLAKQLRSRWPGAAVEVFELPEARADPTLIRQALVNLIDNALKFSSKAPAPRVEVGWSAEEGAYFVRDNGVGFDMAYAGKLFGTFERLHAETEFPGSGIGLAIVKRVLERHGGRAWARGAEGEGATFYFALPS